MASCNDEQKRDQGHTAVHLRPPIEVGGISHASRAWNMDASIVRRSVSLAVDRNGRTLSDRSHTGRMSRVSVWLETLSRVPMRNGSNLVAASGLDGLTALNILQLAHQHGPVIRQQLQAFLQVAVEIS